MTGRVLGATHAPYLLPNVSIASRAYCQQKLLRPSDDTDTPSFKRMSLECFGKVDIDGLWLLRQTCGDYPRFDGFEERADVSLVGEQWYHAVPGTEYLAANPTESSQVVDLIESCIKPATDVVFSLLPSSGSANDPFQALSPELRMMLLDTLDRQDVANLRLSSKTFSQLPQTYFKQLIRDEMPWVWELHDTGSVSGSGGPAKGGIDWFTLWNKLSAADGGDCSDEKARENGERADLSGDLRAGEIKGLRNRRMIHRDISIILDMMAEVKAAQAS